MDGCHKYIAVGAYKVEKIAAIQETDLTNEVQMTIGCNEWKYVAKVETHFDDRLPPVPCVLDEFNQVILNITVNAAQAIASAMGKDESSKGKITIITKNRQSEMGCGTTFTIRLPLSLNQ